MSEADRLIAEGQALLKAIDDLDAEQEKERTWGSMALSSFRSDNFHLALEKFRQADELLQAEENAKLNP